MASGDWRDRTWPEPGWGAPGLSGKAPSPRPGRVRPPQAAFPWPGSCRLQGRAGPRSGHSPLPGRSSWPVTRAGRRWPRREGLFLQDLRADVTVGPGDRPAFSAGCPGNAGAERPLNGYLGGRGQARGGGSQAASGTLTVPCVEAATQGPGTKGPGGRRAAPTAGVPAPPGQKAGGGTPAGGRDAGRGQLRPGLGVRASAGAPWAGVAGASRPIPRGTSGTSGTSGGRAAGWGLGLTGPFQRWCRPRGQHLPCGFARPPFILCLMPDKRLDRQPHGRHERTSSPSVCPSLWLP